MSRKGVIMLIGVVAILVGPFQMVATAKRVPVQVDVQFEAKDLINQWGPQETKKIQEEARRLLAEYLKANYNHWDFRHDLPNTRRILRFRVVSEFHNTIQVYLEPYIGSRQDDRWSCTWFEPGDWLAGRYPNAKQAAKELKRAVEMIFMIKHRQNVLQWLKRTVPLGKTGVWVDGGDPSQMVLALSLPHKEYRDLGESVFHVVGRLPRGPRETLEVLGTGIFEPFPPGTSTSQFKGLLAMAHRHRLTDQFTKIEGQLVKRVRNLKRLGPVYLSKYVRPTDQDVALFKEDIP